MVLGVVPARGGSRRVKRKNIKLLGGKPLIAWTLEEAKKASSLDYLLVSTDDPDIAEFSRSQGVPVPFKRPPELSVDCDTSLVLRHALQWYEKKKKKQVGYVVCLQPTSPFRWAEDIDRCLQIARVTNAETVVSVSKTKQHPYWCFEMAPVNQRLVPHMESGLRGDKLVSQNLPLFFYPNGAVYVTVRDMILEGKIFGDLYRIWPYKMSEERSIDLETPFDFFVASQMIAFYGHNHHVWLVSET